MIHVIYRMNLTGFHVFYLMTEMASVVVTGGSKTSLSFFGSKHRLSFFVIDLE